MTADVELPPLPEPYGYLRELDGGLQISIGSARPADRAGGYATPWAAMYDAGRVRQATAAQAAEIEALRAKANEHRDGRLAALERAEQLAGALRDAKTKMLAQVKWEACDCGCPQGKKPADAASVAWLRASALLRDQEEGK